jgi:hypothetical protein
MLDTRYSILDARCLIFDTQYWLPGFPAFRFTSSLLYSLTSFSLLSAVAICLLGCSAFSMAFGCMYNVRDVGFTDIGVRSSYRLYYYIREDMSEDLISMFRRISYAAFMDSNVEVEVINVDEQRDHPDPMVRDPAMEYLDFWEVESFPAAILVSPRGQSLVLPICAPNKPFKQTVWSALESVVTSPKREEILSSIVKAYCVVLLIQGRDAAENRRVQAVVVNAIEEISRIMTQMPRSIEEPPRLILIPPESFSREKILLWSLGVNRDQGSGSRDQGGPYSLLTNPCLPVVAVLYGRGRRIGPLLEGERVTVNAVFNILCVIGESCECGLDRGWVLGTMLPLRWREDVRSEMVRLLGFDPESPMVKTEISQILSMGSSLGLVPEPPRTPGSEGMKELQEGTYGRPGGSPLQYSEAAVELESGSPRTRGLAAMVSPAQFRKLVSPKPAVSTAGMSPYQRLLFIVGGMVLLILAGGISVMLRTRRRASSRPFKSLKS